MPANVEFKDTFMPALLTCFILYHAWIFVSPHLAWIALTVLSCLCGAVASMVVILCLLWKGGVSVFGEFNWGIFSGTSIYGFVSHLITDYASFRITDILGSIIGSFRPAAAWASNKPAESPKDNKPDESPTEPPKESTDTKVEEPPTEPIDTKDNDSVRISLIHEITDVSEKEHKVSESTVSSSPISRFRRLILSRGPGILGSVLNITADQVFYFKGIAADAEISDSMFQNFLPIFSLPKQDYFLLQLCDKIDELRPSRQEPKRESSIVKPLRKAILDIETVDELAELLNVTKSVAAFINVAAANPSVSDEQLNQMLLTAFESH